MEDESLKRKRKLSNLLFGHQIFFSNVFTTELQKINQICFSFCLGNEKKKNIYIYIYLFISVENVVK